MDTESDFVRPHYGSVAQIVMTLFYCSHFKTPKSTCMISILGELKISKK